MTEFDKLVKKANAIQTTNTSNLAKKLTITQTLKKSKKKTYHDHSNKYITTQEFNSKLTSENFAARLPRANLASRNYIAALVKKINFNDKLKSFSKKINSNKKKHVEGEKKITDSTNKVA